MTVLSYLYSGNMYTLKDSLYVEMEPRVTCLMYGFPQQQPAVPCTPLNTQGPEDHRAAKNLLSYNMAYHIKP